MIIANNNPNTTVMSIDKFLTPKHYGAACKAASVSSYSHALSLELRVYPRGADDLIQSFFRT